MATAKRKTKNGGPGEALRRAALAYPGAVEEFPWGERVVKVKKKVFAFLGHDEDDSVGLSVKLPHSGGFALSLPFATPTAYGLGKSGWVSASFDAGDDVPVDMLLSWIDESYRAVAPKKLVAGLDSDGAAAPVVKSAKSTKSRTVAKKPTKPKR
jgi:predicted DNA-binding protein (MmcQ/YjbR family)